MRQRLYIIFIFLSVFLSSFGQKIKIMPKVGFTISNLSNQKLAITDDYGQKVDSKPLMGVTAGVDFKYTCSNHFDLISGLSYIQQGCSFRNVIGNDGKNQKNKLHYDYLGLPIKLRYKIIDGLGVSTGLVFGYLVRAKHNDEDIKSICNKFDYSLPISISYEFRNHVVVEASYQMGLNKVYEEGSTKNRSFNCVIGYKF